MTIHQIIGLALCAVGGGTIGGLTVVWVHNIGRIPSHIGKEMVYFAVASLFSLALGILLINI